MSTYQELKGLKVKFLDSDTSGDRATEGEIFYNSSGPNVSVHIATGAWSAGSNLITNRKNGSGFGPSTAAAFAGGQVTTPSQNLTEEYNGSGWSTSGNLNTARTQLGGTTAGSQTAGLVFGGNIPPGSAPHANESNATEEYDGTSWTSGNNMATTVTAMGGSGTQTAAFSAGGSEGGTPKNNSQEYDGTNWSNGNNINTARQALAGMGTQTAGLVVGGEVSPPSSSPGATEEYDGTNWTAGGATNTGRHSSSGGGTQTAGIVFAGTTVSPDAVRDETELYDGSSWTEVGDLATARTNVGGYNGPSSSGICVAGGAPSLTGATEEFNLSINTTTAAAWASSNNIGTARDAHGAGGTQTAGIIFGGNKYPGNTENTELYDGSSWTETANLNTARRQTTGCGTQTAALCAGGYTTANSAATEEWNGSAWTSSGDLATNRRNAGLFGIQTAAVYCGGYDVPDANSTVIQNYDGSSWTNNPASLNTGGNDIAATGSSTAGVIFGYSNNLNGTEEWNGSSMSTGGTMITSKYGRGSANQAPSENVLSAGGGIPAQTTCEGYDGTSWSTRPSIATATNSSKGGGTATAAFIAGGGPGAGPIFNTSSEFTGDTTAASAKTIDFD